MLGVVAASTPVPALTAVPEASMELVAAAVLLPVSELAWAFTWTTPTAAVAPATWALICEPVRRVSGGAIQDVQGPLIRGSW